MGLKSNFYRDRCGRDNRKTHNIKHDLGGRKILLIDVSIWFHNILSSSDVVDQFHTSPPIPVTSFLAKFQFKHESIVKLGVVPFYVFDGTRNPLKGDEDARRRKAAEDPNRDLSELYKRCDPSDYDLVKKMQKKATTVRNDMIALLIGYLRQNRIGYIQAPSEADPMLVYLLNNGFGDCILTEDSDMFALGAKRWMTRLALSTGACNIFDTSDATAEDENAEFEALFNSADDSNSAETIKVCAEAKRMLAESHARAACWNSDREYGYKICVDQIRQANKARLDDIGGPNESLDSKLEQVNLLLAIEEAAQNDKICRSLLTHYTHNMQHALRRWKGQLEKCKEQNIEPDNQPAKRLGKAPAGSGILADKGFAGDDFKYECANEVITPSFLEARLQFSTAEMLRDAPIKKRRWPSEANFRRITEVGGIEDRVPRQMFPQFHNAVDYAHGRQNAIGNPYYYPSDTYFRQDSDDESDDGRTVD